jgi:MFS transporter, ACS family, hexuronate transporter
MTGKGGPTKKTFWPDWAQQGRFRWLICLLLLAVTTLGYINRLVFSIVAPVVAGDYHLSNFDIASIINGFLVAYAFGQLFAGAFIDWIGLKTGFTLAVLVWSLACIFTSLARGVRSFIFYQFLLGLSQSANFPGGVKAAGEWFPSKERSTAVGIFSSGASIGAILAPPIVVFLILHFGWQAACIFVGVPGLFWIPFWVRSYAPVEVQGTVTASERAYILSGRDEPRVGYSEHEMRWPFFLRQRAVWGILLGRFIEEPVSWFYFTWLAVYLRDFRHVALGSLGTLLIFPFVTLDAGYVIGGWSASRLMKAGWSLNRARKTAMVLSALCMVSSIPAVRAPTSLGFIALIGIATFGHGAWGANIFTLPADIVPHRWTGTVYGMTAFGGGLGSIIFIQMVGKLVDVERSFNTVFSIAGILPLVAAIVVLTVGGKFQRIEYRKLSAASV